MKTLREAFLLVSIIATTVAAPGCGLSSLEYYTPPVQPPEDVEAGGEGFEVDASLDPMPDQPEEGTDPHIEPQEEVELCVPGSSWCNADGNLETCNASGTGTTVERCPFFCSSAPQPRCLTFVPSNVDDPSLLCVPGTTELTLDAESNYIYLDTDTGAIYLFDAAGNFISVVREAGDGLNAGINFARRFQPDGAPPIGIFSFRRFELPSGVTLVASGNSVLAIFSCEDVRIAGLIHGGAFVTYRYGSPVYLPGPGGGLSGAGPGAGDAGSSGNDYTSGGGGGGSFGGRGGDGGTGSTSAGSAPGGLAGGPYGSAELVPLWGGSGGGNGADNEHGYGAGGLGGGGVQISTAASLTVEAGGGITVCGGGGFGSSRGGGGGGGGSGGAILLEAHTITIESHAIVAANGGGGGSSGAYWNYILGNNGQEGLLSLEAAAGGQAPTPNACAGGAGNSGYDVDGQTPACTSQNRNGGGGGGGAGRIRLNAMILDLMGTLSPSLTAPNTTTTTGRPNVR